MPPLVKLQFVWLYTLIKIIARHFAFDWDPSRSQPFKGAEWRRAMISIRVHSHRNGSFIPFIKLPIASKWRYNNFFKRPKIITKMKFSSLQQYNAQNVVAKQLWASTSNVFGKKTKQKCPVKNILPFSLCGTCYTTHMVPKIVEWKQNALKTFLVVHKSSLVENTIQISKRRTNT